MSHFSYKQDHTSLIVSGIVTFLETLWISDSIVMVWYDEERKYRIFNLKSINWELQTFEASNIDPNIIYQSISFNVYT